uniref:Disease resistance protein At4g27190-like leucine-rich repeats domain-containing protein n=1 Tax=Fagus sylvatica TaxID=28930 RepID=A0A2N9FK91_FAGSY
MVQLKNLFIKDCKVMEEILLTEDLGEEEEIIPMVLFPRLEDLRLKDLPILKRFCVGSNIKFPSLKDMWIEQCPKLKSFIFKPVNSSITVSKEVKEMNSEEISLTTMQPLFNEEARCLMQLKDLRVFDCGVEEIVAHEDGAEAAARLVFPKVTVLLLSKSLVQLKKLSVSECESITEVVAGEGGEGNEVITFSQLTYLKLDCLPNLTSFCSRSYSFEFPSLEEVIVSKCPEMKIFCHGILSTPKLERVQATKEDEWHWKVDLNTTVRTLALEGQTMIPLCNSSSE